LLCNTLHIVTQCTYARHCILMRVFFPLHFVFRPLDQAASRICAFRGLFHGFGKLVLVSPLQTIKREPWSFVSTAGHRDGLSGMSLQHILQPSTSYLCWTVGDFQLCWKPWIPAMTSCMFLIGNICISAVKILHRFRFSESWQHVYSWNCSLGLIAV
jgi:hypothetical protein